MSRRATGVLAGAVLATVLATAPAQASSGINAYRFKATAQTVEKLAQAGFDVTEGRRAGARIEVYGTKRQMARLARKEKIRGKLVRDKRGRTSVRRSVRMVRRGLAESGARSLKQAGDPTATASDAAYKVYRKYDAVPGDGHEQYTEMYDRIAGQYPGITEKIVLGKTEWGRDIVAMQVTRNATGADNGKPAVLYNAMQHAREWLAGETCKRTLDHFTRLYGKDRQVTRLVNERQLWFVCVNNPDGYEYTFTEGNRLWRKNLARQTATGIQNGDGVDPNRNFPVNWGLDNEGSSPDLASETYRGPSAASEPETKAMLKLWEMVQFVFQKNDHTAAELILYPQGWQQYTPSADDPIFRRCRPLGRRSDDEDEDPAIHGLRPGPRRRALHHQRRHARHGLQPQEHPRLHARGLRAARHDGLRLRVRGRRGPDRGRVPAPPGRSSLDLAESADDPANPDSHLGNTVEDFYVDSFAVLLRRSADRRRCRPSASLGAVTMKYRINGGTAAAGDDEGGAGGERYYQEAGADYHRLRGTVTGTEPGRHRRGLVRERERASASRSFTYSARSEPRRDQRADPRRRGLHGPDAARTPTAPHYLAGYSDALAANGFAPDVYDVDAMGREAPDPLGRARALRRGRLVHGRRLPDPRAGPGPPAPDVAPRARGDRRRPRLPQRGRQGVPRRQARRPAVLRGLRVPQRRVPAARRGQEGRVVRRRRSPSREATPSDGCIAAHQRLLPVLPGGVPARGGRQGRGTTRRATCAPSCGTAPFTGTWTPGDAAADPSAARRRRRSRPRRRCSTRRRTTTSPRSSPSWRPPRGGPVHAAQRQPVHVLRRRRPGVQAAVHADPGAGRRRDADVLDLVRHRAGLGLLLRRGAPPATDDVDDAARGRRAHVRQRRRVLPRRHGLGEDLHSRLLNYQTDDGDPAIPRARPARGTRPPARPAAGRTGRST